MILDIICYICIGNNNMRWQQTKNAKGIDFPIGKKCVVYTPDM